MKTITTKFLESHNACSSGMTWVTENGLIGLPAKGFLNRLISGEKEQWGNWLIVRLMNKKQKVQYAIFAAEQVINIFEKKYPDDDRPRKAIEVAKNYLNNPNKKTKAAAYAAAYAAYAAYAAADAAYADDDAYAAYAAADAAAAAAADEGSYADDADAYAAAAYAAYAAADARKEMQIRILNYGMSIIFK
jgi:hypothetical protein